MNQIRHEQIQRTGNLASGSALWTTGSQAIADQYLPNARSIEDRITFHVNDDLHIVSGSTPGEAGASIVGNITKSGNTITVTKVVTPSGGGQTAYLNASFGEVGGATSYLESIPEQKSSIDIGGTVYDSGDYGHGWYPLVLVEENSGEPRISLREPAIFLFTNGVSQEIGPNGYMIDWDCSDPTIQADPFSRIWVSSDCCRLGDKLSVLHLTATNEFKYAIAFDEDV